MGQDTVIDGLVRQARLIRRIEEELVSLGEQETSQVTRDLKKIHRLVIRFQDQELVLQGEELPELRADPLLSPEPPRAVSKGEITDIPITQSHRQAAQKGREGFGGGVREGALPCL